MALTHFEQLRRRYQRSTLGAEQQLGFWPLLLKPLLRPQQQPQQQGPVPPQAAYPPPRRPLPAAPAPLLAEVVKLLKTQQESEKPLESENELAYGADGNLYAVDAYGQAIAGPFAPGGGGGRRPFPGYRQPQGAEVMGAELGAEDFGADLDENDPSLDFGAEELMSGNCIDEETGDDFGYGLDVPRAQGKLEEIKTAMQQVQARISTIQSRPGLFKEKRVAAQMKKLGKLRSKAAELQGQINAEKAKRRKIRQQAASLADFGQQRGGGGQLRQGNQPGEVPGTRGGQTSQRVISAAEGNRIRQTQANEGQRYSVNRTPPGSGRLLSIPMLASSSSTNRNSITIAAANVAQGNQTLTSEQTPYSEYKIVGFTANTRLTGQGAATAVQIASGMAFVDNLQIKGSPNLFLHDSAQDANEYATTLEHLQGLRYYPNVKSPNQATVDIFAVANFVDVIVIVTANLVVEQVTDDTYGSGVPGPYSG